jgi:hypothetical protein
MLRHVCMFRWNPDADDQVRDQFVTELEKLLGSDERVRDHRVGTNVGPMGDNFDVVLVADFDDLDGYLAYEASPRHDDFVRQHASGALGERSAVQHAW